MFLLRSMFVTAFLYYRRAATEACKAQQSAIPIRSWVSPPDSQGSPHQNSDCWRLQSPAATAQLHIPTVHQHFPPCHHTKVGCTCQLLPPQIEGPLLATELKSLIRNLLGREPGKMESQMYTSHTHFKAKRGSITNAAGSKFSCLKSLGTHLVVWTRAAAHPTFFRLLPLM